MWDRRKLQELVQREADTFKDGRIGRLHAAVARYDGRTLERSPPETEITAELTAALSAVTAEELRLLFTVAPTSKVLERLLAEAEKHPPSLDRPQKPAADQDEDSEPEQR